MVFIQAATHTAQNVGRYPAMESRSCIHKTGISSLDAGGKVEEAHAYVAIAIAGYGQNYDPRNQGNGQRRAVKYKKERCDHMDVICIFMGVP